MSETATAAAMVCAFAALATIRSHIPGEAPLEAPEAVAR
jgi:hypothetical protein